MPIVGMGGVATVEDVLEFIACGARVVAVGSAGLQDQSRARCLAGELGEQLHERGLTFARTAGSCSPFGLSLAPARNAHEQRQLEGQKRYCVH